MRRSFLIILICLLFLTGCGNKDERDIEEEKLLTEIDYFSSSIANMLNNLNNISLQNYELASEKVSSNNSSEGSGSNQSSSGSSSSQGEGQDSQASSQGGEQGEKSSQEDFSSITITEMRNNSVLNTDTENVNWDYMRKEIENMNSSWNIVMLDLYNNNAPNEEVLAFGDLLNQTILSIKNEDKRQTLINLSSLYVYIPKFLDIISAEKSKQNIENTKSQIFIAYSAASVDDWSSAIASVSNAENSFLKVLNDTEYSNNKEHKVNMTYMLIKDLQTSATSNDKILFFLKYKNLIENINIL